MNTEISHQIKNENHTTAGSKPEAVFSFIKSLKPKPFFVKTFALVFILSTVLLAQKSFAKSTTWNRTLGGAWTNAGYWTNGVPANGDDVIINSDQSAAITAVPNISLASLAISGNCNLQSSAGAGSFTTITITGTFNLSPVKTLQCGTTNLGRINFTLAATATGVIDGTVFMNSYNGSGYDRTFANNGNLSITSTGLVTGQNTSIFANNSGATLQIGSPAGITTSGSNGNVQVPGTRTYSTTANYIYIGTANQVTGNGLTTASNLTINTASPSVTVTSTTPFTAANLSVTQGNLILQGTTANYTVSNDLTIATNGTLTHGVNWDASGRLLSVAGNITIDGIFDYTVRSHVQMTGTGTKTVKTGSNPASSFSILTLLNGTFNASGTLKVDDNFWAMIGSTGSFHTNGQTVTASAGILNNNGTVFIDGGTLNVTGGLAIGEGTNGAVVFSAGTLNADAINVGNGTVTGTFTQSGGICNVSGSIFINSGCSFTCTNSPAINLAGNFTNNGTYTKASETVTFNGAGQTMGGTSATTFNNLALSGSGTKIFSAARTISGNLSIATDVKANLGTFTSSANTLTLGGTGAPGGSWGSTASSADNKNDIYFTAGTGVLNVTAGSCGTITATATQTNITCFGANDGTITISAGGGQNPYTFSIEEPANWLPATGTNLRLFTNLLPNVAYIIKVKDNNGCTSSVNP